MGLLIDRGEEPVTHGCGVKERTLDLRKIKSEEKEDSGNGKPVSGRHHADTGAAC